MSDFRVETVAPLVRDKKVLVSNDLEGFVGEDTFTDITRQAVEDLVKVGLRM